MNLHETEVEKESELDEMWSFIGKKANQRWLWHAIERTSGKVLAYVFGTRKDEVFLQLKACYYLLGLAAITLMIGGHMNVI